MSASRGVATPTTAKAPLAPAAARVAQFTLFATVNGRYGTYSPWSPSAPLFAYSDDAGVAVLDVSQSPPSPKRIVAGIDGDCTWSPDGAWLLVRTPGRRAGAQGAALVVVAAKGGTEIVIADDILVSDFTWAADGQIYYWDYETPKPHVVQAPADWARANAGPFTARPLLVFAFGGGAPAAQLFDVRAGAVNLRVLAALAGRPRSILRADGFPDGRLLVHESGAMDDGPGRNRILDSNGAEVAQLRAKFEDGAFAATSVSGDGTFVAGECLDDAGDGVASAVVLLVAVDGAWTARVDGVQWGTQPRLSRVGSWLAYTDAEGRAHIGAVGPPSSTRSP